MWFVDEGLVVTFDKEVCFFIFYRNPQAMRFVFQIEYIWVCNDFSKVSGCI